MKYLFTAGVAEELIGRINELKPDTAPLWGKMTVDQMLAHLSVMFVFTYEPPAKRPHAFVRWVLQQFVKETVVGEKPYKKNTPTAPAFRIADRRDFLQERARLVDYILRTESLGESYFDGKVNHSFGKLSKRQWSNLFYKHIDHHLRQFGV